MISGGSVIGAYRILATIGAGGMGTVYLGEHTLLGRRAAVKLLNPDVTHDHSVVDRFFNEARASAAINHPGIVQIFDFGYAEDGTAYLVMELLEGADLATRIEREGPLTVPDALRVVRQVAGAMAAAHTAGILHRDLKPDNIFLVPDAEVAGGLRAKVLDFGIAKLTSERRSDRITQAGSFLGTPRYMSPEQLRAAEIDARSDIYSLGLVLYEALTGTPPFDGESVGELAVAHLTVAPRPPSSVRATVPADLDAVVLRCLEKDPVRRFQSMGALADALEDALEGAGAGGSAYTSLSRVRSPWRRTADASLELAEGPVPPEQPSELRLGAPEPSLPPGDQRRQRRRTPPDSQDRGLAGAPPGSGPPEPPPAGGEIPIQRSGLAEFHAVARGAPPLPPPPPSAEASDSSERFWLRELGELGDDADEPRSAPAAAPIAGSPPAPGTATRVPRTIVAAGPVPIGAGGGRSPEQQQVMREAPEGVVAVARSPGAPSAATGDVALRHERPRRGRLSWVPMIPLLPITGVVAAARGLRRVTQGLWGVRPAPLPMPGSNPVPAPPPHADRGLSLDADAEPVSPSTIVALPRPATGSVPPQELAGVFETAVPPAFRDLLPYAIEFFRELFRTARPVGDHLIELAAPVIDDLEQRAHHVMFLSAIEADAAAPFGQIGTRMFRAQVDPFARHLAELAVPAGSVLITVLAAPQLGQGARETIFALRRERNLFVVPIAAAEIRRACEAGNAREVVISRIAELHTISDPFAVAAPSVDPTCWIGFAAEVADLVRHIVDGGKIVSVAGPPGSGKTSLVAMAEYGCDTSNVARQFVRIPCGDAASHDPARLLEDMTSRVQRLQSGVPRADGPAASAPATTASAASAPAAGASAAGEPATTTPPTAAASSPFASLPNLRKTVMMLGVQPMAPAEPTIIASSAVAGLPGASARPVLRETGLARRHQLVLVLEDADWLIRMGSSAEPEDGRRGAARELWRGLAELCASGKHTVIVTSIRDFQVMEQQPLERPVSVSRVPMRALTRRESAQLVRSLGELVGFQPTRRALELLYRASGGNVYALRLLCSDIIRSARERADYSPLAPLTVTPRMVSAAADRIAATGSSFRTHVSLWLDRTETVVLQHVARQRPRSARRIRRALRGSAAPPQIGKALDALELMSLVEHRRGRHRVRIPLFERWINTHLDDPDGVATAAKQRQVSRLALGFTCTAVLFGGYWTWLRSTRSAPTHTIGDCTYEVDHPDRVGLDESFELRVTQECATAAPHALAIEAVFSALSPPTAAADCPATSPACTMTVKLTAGNQAHDLYQVRLRVDHQPVMTAAIDKDRFATIRSIGERSVPAISFIPAILALVLSFHKEARRYVGQLFGGSDESGPPGAPPGASPPARPPDS